MGIWRWVRFGLHTVFSPGLGAASLCSGFFCHYKNAFPFARMNREETRTPTLHPGSFSTSYSIECSNTCRASKDGQTFSFSDQKDELSGWGPPETWRESPHSAGCCLLCHLVGKDSSLVLIHEGRNTHNPQVAPVSERQTCPPLGVPDTPCPHL